MIKYLGIDFGLSHIGLASSEHTLATPLSSLRNDASLFTHLQSIIKAEGITIIICGIPEGSLAPQVKDFATHLHELTGLPVILHPETLSSQDAKHKLHQAGASLAKKKNDHAYAACLILEDYLELNNHVY